MPERNTVSWSVLIQAYARHSRLDLIERAFWRLEDQTVVAWSSIIQAFAQKGHGQQALNLFRLMELDGGASPDEITFVGILTACGHLGDLKEALRQFYSVTTDRKNLAITAEHYGCLIDILARLGHLGPICLRACPSSRTVPLGSL
ncbi:hypothetical protein SELMODRAFT_95926 [Selaginella moellendorffii]|uniref:Pentacotripeptide-repeat region of PRORP domain-containing protein n=1 Tax=Selaginella moellendorffii TaxID=88036 RepID=D8RKN2_SELML|nr:hypothetical protein SELMODRAFT_95926 [Selaginella moellendorffii]